MHTKAYGRWKMFSSVFLGAGVVSIIVGYLSYSHAHALLQRAVPAAGVVAGYETSISNSDTAGGASVTSYSPRIRFRASSGEQVEFVASSSNQQQYQVNSAVTVLYDPQKPSDAMLRTDAFESSSLAGSMIPGGILLFLGALTLVILVVLKKRLAWLRTNGRRISADFVRIASRGDEFKSYYVVCQWVNPETNQTHQFKSHALSSDPKSRLGSKKIDVLIDPGKPNRYWVDMDSILST